LFRVDEALNKSGNKLLNILVGNESGRVGQSCTSSLLDIGLGVVNDIGKDRDDERHGRSNLFRCALDELIEDGEATNLDLPFAGSVNLVQKNWQQKRDGPRGHDLDKGKSGIDGSSSDGGDLVCESVGDEDLEDLFEDERFDGMANTLFAKVLNESASALTGDGILLVVQAALNSV